MDEDPGIEAGMSRIHSTSLEQLQAIVQRMSEKTLRKWQIALKDRINTDLRKNDIIKEELKRR
jgi:hypothetical protein